MNVGVIKRILPARYPALVAGLFTYLFVGVVYENLFGRRYRLGKLDEAMESTTIPYWKDSKKVVNLDRIFFDLDDYKKNKINILYHGMYFFIYPKAILTISAIRCLMDTWALILNFPKLHMLIIDHQYKMRIHYEKDFVKFL